MSLLSILYYIIIMPIQILFETIFSIAFNVSMNAGMSIFALSLAMNFLVLPLYNYADAMQAKAMALETELSYGINHIKKTFHGDEQLMMLQTYYRQNHYSPYNVMKCSLPVLLEIPFFIAAYDFLSQLDILRGMTLGPIKDLGTPDGLLVYGDYTINLLPLIMTLLNVVATYFFAKSYLMGTKLQLYGIAGFFLIFLYNSPAGLVFYWTLNNLFNLIKTIVLKTNKPQKFAVLILIMSGLYILGTSVFFTQKPLASEIEFAIMYFGFTMIMLFRTILTNRNKKKCYGRFEDYNTKGFIVAAIFLTVLLGVVIPSNVISSSPQEFIILGCLSNPLEYIVYALCISIGVFLLWAFVFYYLAMSQDKYRYELAMYICCIIALWNYLFFGGHLGTMDSNLQYEKELYYSLENFAVNLTSTVFIIVLIYKYWRKLRSILFSIVFTGLLALFGVGVFNLYYIYDHLSLDNYLSKEPFNEKQIISFSRTGNNVIVIMLDRTIGPYIPYIFNEKPALKTQFSGFVYYPNTISFGGCTNIGSPALFGGYEYTPFGINSRADMPLKIKHNEALKIMPFLFDNNGFSVTVCDPTYANYKWIPDLTIYDERPLIKKYNTMGRVSSTNNTEYTYNGHDLVKANRRNFFVHSIFKCVPIGIQFIVYEGGNYHSLLHRYNQQELSFYACTGIKKSFIDSYNVLDNLPNLIKINNGINSFVMLTNDTTHNYCMLKMPEYIPAKRIDNTFYEEYISRFDNNGNKLTFYDSNNYKGYQVNMSAFIRLGNFLEFMKKNNIYNNTRIILVSDHGSVIKPFDDLVTKDGLNTLRFRPLLMVKDFNRRGQIVSSNQLMSNADVPRLAMQGIIENPINPFTGKNIFDNEFSRGKQYVFTSGHWSVDFNNGNQFIADDWYTVEGDINNMDNWHLVKKNAVLPY